MTIEITHYDDSEFHRGEQVYVIHNTNTSQTIEMSHNYSFGTTPKISSVAPVAIRTPEHDDIVDWVSMNEDTLEAINLVYVLLLKEREDYDVEGN